VTIAQDLRNPVKPGYVELFQLDLTALGGSVLYFTPHTVGGSTSVSFGGQVYTALPIGGSGWETSIDGAPPQPVLTVSNVNRFIQSYLSTYHDLVGARLTRITTFDKYLDSGSSPNSTQVISTNTYLIEQKTRQNKVQIDFKLSSLIDAPQFKLPRGQVLRKDFPGAGLYRKQ
jgi:lambda family phage minor tail protein L